MLVHVGMALKPKLCQYILHRQDNCMTNPEWKAKNLSAFPSHFTIIKIACGELRNVDLNRIKNHLPPMNI